MTLKQLDFDGRPHPPRPLASETPTLRALRALARELDALTPDSPLTHRLDILYRVAAIHTTVRTRRERTLQLRLLRKGVLDSTHVVG